MTNEEKNTYVVKRITDTTIALLREREFSDITISQITSLAQVSRNSFYRNYVDKEDILLYHIRNLFSDWDAQHHMQSREDGTVLYGSLFSHIQANSDFYLLLKKRGLFHLCLRVLMEEFGPKPEYDNMTAYVTSFVTYGTFGWIEEWVGRGMVEPAETVSAMLATYGMK